MKKLLALTLALAMALSLASCGGSSSSTSTPSNPTTSSTPSASTDSSTDSSIGLDDIGAVEVDKGLFDVTFTVPADLVGDDTQEEREQEAKEKGFKSVTTNEDGSVTYVMTKAQHEEMMVEIKASVDESLQAMIGEDYPTLRAIEANSDYTEFAVTVDAEELGFEESFSVFAIYMYAGIYHAFNGTEDVEVSVKFINATTGAVIKEVNSADAG